ncbi:hypothetical protein GCM10009788_27170 [Nocardioides humi]|uniref:Rhamnan synthesis protein F n=1 Tax=Nocardioides humi TaxID=449461 RepID=A0ABN2ALG5_9ACTN
MTPQEFTSAWHAFVARWHALARDDRRAAAALVRDAVRSGLPSDGPDAPNALDAPDAEALLACEVAVIRAARAMRGRRYAKANADLKVLRDKTLDPVEHFCRMGWRWLRNPRPDFDVWWYWNEYLDPTRDDIDPLLFHVLVGRHAGNATTPPPTPERHDSAALAEGARRICLYAAYDADGVIDDYVLHYLRELSRHADVYYLADGVMPRAELDKLADVTVAAWAIPHARYDFGSYSMLATELVGWETIEQYDELLFANDSCYLLRSLDETFARMDRRPADWWGMQATKMDFSRGEGHTRPIPLAEAKRLHTPVEEWNPHYRIHLSSYLLAFRRPVFTDPGFRRRLGAVVKQAFKDLVILKYEIGLSDYLIDAGFDFDTFIPDLYPFHPLYSSDYFDLLAQGFPLLKRNFVGESTGTPDLGRWKERVLEHAPDAPVEMFERNLRRVAPADKLARTAQIRTGEDGRIDYRKLLNRKEFRLEDRIAPKFDHWWAFPVSTTEHALTGNERAVFEEVRHDPSVKKIVLTRSREVDLDGENVVVLPLASRDGQEHLARAGQVFVRHAADLTLPWEIDLRRHRVIDLGEGLPKPGAPAPDPLSPRASSGKRPGRHVVVSSAGDTPGGEGREASQVEVWPTGQPRHAFLLRPESDLPDDLRTALAALRTELAGRRLVLWLPARAASSDLGDAGVAALGDWLRRHDAVVGVRAPRDAHRLADLDPLLLMPRRWPDVEVLYRASAVLVTDDRAHHRADYALTGRPVVLLDKATRADLPAALDRALEGGSARPGDAPDLRADDGAAWRVVQRVRQAGLSDPAPPPAARRPSGRARERA